MQLVYVSHDASSNESRTPIAIFICCDEDLGRNKSHDSEAIP